MAKKTVRLDDGQGNTLYPEAGESRANYTKLADGTLILSGISGVGSIPKETTLSTTVAFEESFIAQPKVTISCFSSSPQYFSVGLTSVGTNSFKINVHNGSSSTRGLDVQWIAFGRWK